MKNFIFCAVSIGTHFWGIFLFLAYVANRNIGQKLIKSIVKRALDIYCKISLTFK